MFFVPTIMLSAMAEMEDMGIRRVVTHGEKAAAYMADGYARAARQPGICLAQAIGSANLAAGLRDAFMACSPVIALMGGVTAASRYKHTYLEIEDFPMWEQVTKANFHVDALEREGARFETARPSSKSSATSTRCRSGRGDRRSKDGLN